MQRQLSELTERGGSLLVSGSFVGSDMQQPDERSFLARVLKCQYGGTNPATDENVTGMGTKFDFYRHLNERHYAATHPDILSPVAPGGAVLAYTDNTGAAVAYSGTDYRAFTMGFPLECIKDEATQASVMQGILNYLLQ